MKKTLLTLFALLSVAGLFAGPRWESQLENWRFTRDDVAAASAAEYDDAAWQSVTVPHDWAIYGPFDLGHDVQNVAIEQNGETRPTEKTGRTGGLPFIGVGWYRTSFELSPEDVGRRVVITFDGAMSDANVWVNGKKAGNWPYGYSTFWFDISELVKSGENVVAVRLENEGQSSRWYPGAGIYRPVTLTVSNHFSIDKWGVTVTTPEVTDEWAKVKVRLAFNDADKAGELTVRHTIKDAAGTVVSRSNIEGIKLYGNNQDAEIILLEPALWSPESPNLYTLDTEVYSDGVLADSHTTRFGVRTISYTAERGFELNGVQRKFKGVCLHHDLGPLGTAVNEAALRRQVRILKDMGCDAIRTSHNMPSPMQMEIYDEMGMMVMAESFDEWARGKVKNGYGKYYNEWYERDLRNLLRCHRNHPSLVMWCIGNEVPDQRTEHGNRLALRMTQICHEEDPTRPVTCGMDQVDAVIANQFASTLDIPGFNYRTHKYEAAYEALPHGFVLGSETASTVSSRGVYKFPVEERPGQRWEDAQCSSYDLNACSWSNIPEDDWLLQDDKDWVIGEFVWTGFDYLGEPTPYDDRFPSRSSYFGICDLAGLPKDRFWLYRSRWNTEESTLHVLPHWTWQGREGEVTPVFVYTSWPTAEPFVNGESQGKRTKDVSSRENRYRLRWDDVTYEPGEIRVVAYDAEGRQMEEKTVRTAGKAVRLVVEADRAEIKADGKDLSFITVKAVDKEGNLCPMADNRVEFEVEGAGVFRASCNGDATSMDEFHVPSMKLFSGMLVAIVQSGNEAGDIEFTAKSKGLKSATMTIESR